MDVLITRVIDNKTFSFLHNNEIYILTISKSIIILNNNTKKLIYSIDNKNYTFIDQFVNINVNLKINISSPFTIVLQLNDLIFNFTIDFNLMIVEASKNIEFEFKREIELLKNEINQIKKNKFNFLDSSYDDEIFVRKEVKNNTSPQKLNNISFTNQNKANINLENTSNNQNKEKDFNKHNELITKDLDTIKLVKEHSNNIMMKLSKKQTKFVKMKNLILILIIIKKLPYFLN